MRRADPRHLWASDGLRRDHRAVPGRGRLVQETQGAPPPKVEETIGNLAYIQSKGELRLEGVGLVVGLDNTGSNPGPSWYRDQLVDEMRKAGVENPNKLLNSSNLSIVIVRLQVPHGTDTSDRLDAEVELPPGSGTKSLAGGYLLSTRLREMLIAGGLPKQGSDLATAQGPVMIGTEVDAGQSPGRPDPRRRPGQEGDALPAHHQRESAELPDRDAAPGGRQPAVPHARRGRTRTGWPPPRPISYLVLKIPRVYHHNQDRYFRIIKLLPIVDTPGLRCAADRGMG